MAQLSRPAVTLLPKLLATGLYFGESPRWHCATESLYISDMTGCRIYTISLRGNTTSFVKVKNQPNGMCFLDDNTLIYSSMFDAKLFKYQLHNGESKLYADLNGVQRGYCGDMVIDKSGRVFVDDTGARVLHGEAPKPGRLISVEPGGGEVRIAAENIVFPNGIAIDSKGTTLYLSESFAYHLEKFSIDGAGKLGNRQTIWHTRDLAPLMGKAFQKFSCIDGICLDAEDGMWLSMLDYEIFIRRDKDGTITHQIPVDGDATACTLGGEDGKTLFLVVNKVPPGENLVNAMKARRTRCSVLTVQVDIGRGSALP